MLGVQVAVLAITCLVVIVMLLTAPLWMRALNAIGLAIWRQLIRAEDEVNVLEQDEKIVDGEFREVEK